MNERQYNSKLINDKLSRIPVGPNEVLWAKLEAQLATVPTAQPGNVDDNEVGKVSAVKLVAAIGVIGVVVTVLLATLFKQTKKTDTPTAIPSIQVPATPPADPMKADTLKDASEKFRPVIKPGPKKDAPINNIESGDSTSAAQTEIPIATPAAQEALDIKPDSAKTISTPPNTIHPTVDTTKLGVHKKREGYYFDVQKKKKKKDN